MSGECITATGYIENDKYLFKWKEIYFIKKLTYLSLGINTFIGLYLFYNKFN